MDISVIKNRITKYVKKYTRVFGLFGDARLYVLALPIFYMYSQDPDMTKSMLFSTSAFFVVAFALHVLRVLLFPSIEMGKLIDKAEESPLSASIVFAALLIMMSVSMLALLLWTRA